MFAELILAVGAGAGLMYVHTRPKEQLEKFCLWKIGVKIYNHFKIPKEDNS